MLKKLFLVLGGVLCLGLIVAAMYVALMIGLSIYIAHLNVKQMAAERARQENIAAQRIRQSPTMSDAEMTPGVAEKERDDAELAGKLPTLLVDPEGYGVEDNWLASTISREIAEMTFLAMNPEAPLPELKAKAVVDPSKPAVHVEIDGFSAQTITGDFTPVFAWDPDGYAALARQLLSTTQLAASTPASDDTEVLKDLLELTGPKLAAEDVRLSADLQAHPASWQDHEAAALLLMAAAIHNEAGIYADNRPLLNRATAHLALATALRRESPASWPGLMADAAVRTFSGREVDAITHLDAMAARTDVPVVAKPWMEALRAMAKQDWREAEVTADSPLLLKIAWMQVVAQDLSDRLVKSRLKQIVPMPQDDSNAPDQQAANPQALLTDWDRILGRSPFYFASNDDVKNATYKLDLEFHELGEVLEAEGARPLDLDRLADVFSVPVADTVSRDANGQAAVHVIGVGEFTALALGHIFEGLISKVPVPYPAQDPYQAPYSSPSEDPAEAQNLFAKNDALFQGVPGYELARLHLGFIEYTEPNHLYADWENAGKTWPIWEVPYGLADGIPGYALMKKFYSRAVPFGTVFEPDLRITFIRDMDPWKMPEFATPEFEALKKLPLNESIAARIAYSNRYNLQIRKVEPKSPQPFERELLKLDPDNYLLATDHIPQDKLLPVVTRFLDYNINPLDQLVTLDAAHLADADRLVVLRKYAALDPEFGFRAGKVLRGKGLIDEAAEMDRKAVEAGREEEPIGVSNSVMPLVDYDLNHGLKDEALKLAQFAGEVNSNIGLGTEAYALEKVGRLDEAAEVAQHANEMYSDGSWLYMLQIRHPEHWPKPYAEALQAGYPGGVVHAKLTDFSGNPAAGRQLAGDTDTLRAAGLLQGDVVVALDGYRIESELQYDFARAQSIDSRMDFIVWRQDHYLEIKALIPGRRLFVGFADYPPH